MTNHPNRSKTNPARNPTPAEVKAARQAANLSEAECAALVYRTERNWKQWESEAGTASHRRMDAGLFELFQLKTGQATLK